MHGLFLFCGFVSVAFVLLISVYLIISGIPAIHKIGPIKFLLQKCDLCSEHKHGDDSGRWNLSAEYHH